MKFKTILLFVTAVLLIAAAEPQKFLKGKLRSIYMDKWHDTLIYHYDDNGRLSSLSSIKGYHTTYEYTGNTVTARTKGGSTITMYLNNRGLVDSLTDIDTNRTTIMTMDPTGRVENKEVSFGRSRFFPYSGMSLLAIDEIAGVTTHDIMNLSKTYSYNGSGYMTRENIYADSKRPIVANSTIKNGNLYSYSVVYPIDTITMINPQTLKEKTSVIQQSNIKVNNEFDDSKTNTLNGENWFGKSSKNLLMRSAHYDLLSGDSSITIFNYTFDKDGRVSSLITKVKNNDPEDVRIYTERPDTCYFTYY